VFGSRWLFILSWLFLLFVLLFGLLSASLKVSANDYYASAHRITARDGLPEATIYSIARDEKGFLWFGSPTSLMRYDGYEFRQYTNAATDDRALAVSGAGNIFIDSKNRLWVGTWGEGLVLYDDQMRLLQHFKHKKNTPGAIGSNKVQVVFEDSQGDIWIGTNGSGLSLYKEQEQTFINFTHDPKNQNSISHNRIWGIAETQPGVLWIATSFGLNRLDTNVNNRSAAKFVRYEPDSTDPATLNHSLIRSIHTDRKGRLWLGSQVDFGLFDTEHGTFEKIELASTVGINIVTRIREDNDGNILIATQHGLYHYRPDDQQLTPWAGNGKYQLFPQNDVRDVMVDKNSLLWVTTRFAGLIKIDLNPSSIAPIKTFGPNQQSPINKVYSILTDAKQTLWMSTVNGLLRKPVDANEFEKFELPKQINDKNISVMVEDNNGLIWLGGHFGLYTLAVDPSGKALINNRNDVLWQITTKNVQTMMVDSKNNLWIGTTHAGLIKFDQHGESIYYRHDNKNTQSVSSNTIASLFEDNTKQIWVGTSGGGINRLDVEHQTFYRYQYNSESANSIGDNRITDIYQTKDGVMWFSTPKSLEKLDYVSGNFIQYSLTAGLLNNNIKALIEDDFSDLWFSSGSGISQFKRQTQTFHHFTGENQVGNNNFLQGVVAKSDNGNLYFGGTNGISEVQPSKVEFGSALPQSVITNIWVDNRRLASFDYPDGQPLELGPEVKNIQLQFATLDFRHTAENKYRYKLEGYDTDWHNSRTVRTAGYAGLLPGEYVFKAQGNTGENKWGDNVATLTIVISPPWLEIWWIRGLLLSLLLGVAYFWSVFRITRLEKNERLLEQQVSMRTSELDESNKALASTINRLNESQNDLVEKEKMASLGQMVAGISHEVNTPIGMGITAATLLQQRMEDIKDSFEAKALKPAQFNKFLDEGIQSTDIIFRNLERAAKLVNGFKQVAVDQSSDQDRSFKVAQMLDETLLSLSPNFHGTNHSMSVSCSDNLEIYSKPGPLSQVIINLVLNSIKHGFCDVDQGNMSIDVTSDEDNVTLVYRDNGIGVERELQKVIYDPFVTTKRGSGSTGLGMQVVYNIVTQALGGTISLKSEVNAGIEFTIVFLRDVRS
jgi:ligand-binding sensor domain-containing protein/signal transduction histidine kinase